MAGFTFGDIGACNCGCPVTMIVNSACGGAVSGVTVSIYASSGGALLASGITNGSGQVALTVPATGTYYCTVTGMSTRFAAYGQNQVLTCNSGRLLQLQPATGYFCQGSCSLPVATTRHATITVNGNTYMVTITGSVGFFTDTVTGHTWSVSQTAAGTIGVEDDTTSQGCFASTTITCPPSYLATAPSGGTGCPTAWTGTVTITE